MSDALEDCLTHGVDGLSARTVTLYRGTIVKALTEELGGVRLTELTASDAHRAPAAWQGFDTRDQTGREAAPANQDRRAAKGQRQRAGTNRAVKSGTRILAGTLSHITPLADPVPAGQARPSGWDVYKIFTVNVVQLPGLIGV